MVEPTSLRMTLTLPNGTRQEFAFDGPPDVAIEAYRLFLSTPVAPSAIRPVSAPSEREKPHQAMSIQERRDRAEQLIMTMLAEGPIARPRLVDRMKGNGWLEHHTREALGRLEHRQVIASTHGNDVGGRSAIIVSLKPLESEEANVA